MEHDSKSTTAIVPATAASKYAKKPPLNGGEKNKKKKRGAFTFIKAAMFMMRRKSKGKSNPILVEAVPSKGVLNKLVGSMRPLHLQDNLSPPPSVLHQSDHDTSTTPTSPNGSSSDEYSMSEYSLAPNLQELDKEGGEIVTISHYASNLQELHKITSSFPSPSPSSSSSPSPSDSRYASALNLLDLEGDQTDEESDDEGFDDHGGDEMIDAKAEEFISQFYKQMRLQGV